MESILFISCLQRFTLRLNSGALTMADETSAVLLTAPPPHLLTVWETDGTGLKEAAPPWHERGSQEMPLSAADSFSGADNEVVPSMKKIKVCAKCNCFF